VAGSLDDKMTMPLQIEAFYQDLNQGVAKAFALASLLLLLSLITLIIKIVLESRRLAPTNTTRLH